MSKLNLGNRNTAQTADLGRALVTSGVINQNQLDDANRIAERSHRRLEQVLIELAYCSTEVLSAFGVLASMVSQKTVTPGMAAKALNRVHHYKVTAQDALQYLGWSAPEDEENQLGLFLVDAGLLAKSVYQHLLLCGDSYNFSNLLVLRAGLSHEVVNEALFYLALTTRGLASRVVAIAALRKSADRDCDNSLLLAEKKVVNQLSMPADSLGSILTESGLLSSTDRLISVDIALKENKMLGQILIEAGIITESTLAAALKLQGLSRAGVLTPKQVSVALYQMVQAGLSLEEVIERATGSTDQELVALSLQLLTEVGLISQSEIEMASKQSLGLDTLRSLVAVGIITSRVYDTCWECSNLLRTGHIDRTQAATALFYSSRTSSVEAQAAQEEDCSTASSELRNAEAYTNSDENQSRNNLDKFVNDKMVPMVMRDFCFSATLSLLIFMVAAHFVHIGINVSIMISGVVFLVEYSRRATQLADKRSNLQNIKIEEIAAARMTASKLKPIYS